MEGGKLLQKQKYTGKDAYMISETLQKARDYEAQYTPYVSESERPMFHVTGGIGWINDPNGFSIPRHSFCTGL